MGIPRKIGSFNPSFSGQKNRGLGAFSDRKSPDSPVVDSGEGSDEEQIRRKIRKSRILGEFSTRFDKSETEKVIKFLEKAFEDQKDDIKEHIESELERIKKQLNKLFVLEEKITEQKSDDLLEGIDSIFSDDSAQGGQSGGEIIFHGGEDDTDLNGGNTSSGGAIEDQVFKLVKDPLFEDDEALALYSYYLKFSFPYGLERVKNISYKIMSLLQRYFNLKRLIKRMDSDKFNKSKEKLQNEEFLKLYNNVGGVRRK